MYIFTVILIQSIITELNNLSILKKNVSATTAVVVATGPQINKKSNSLRSTKFGI